MRIRVPAALPVLLVGTALLAGCSGDEAPSAGGSATTTSSAGGEGTTAPTSETDGGDDGGDAAGDGATDAPPFPANTEPDTGQASAGARVTVTDIRLGRHDGFDRVVFEVAGTGTPGWDVRYVGAASSQGSGEPVDVGGEAILQVTLTGVGYPYDTDVDEWSGPDPLSADSTEVVTEVVYDATFEGQAVAFVGTGAKVPFRVYSLADPARVVLEVADPS